MLQDWKLKFLSRADIEILLKAVIYAIPTYSMSVFMLHKSLCSEINSLMQKFWWGHRSIERITHTLDEFEDVGSPQGTRRNGIQGSPLFQQSPFSKKMLVALRSTMLMHSF